MKRLALLACLIASPALAQDSQPPVAQRAASDWQMYMLAQGHVVDAFRALAAENEKLKADLAEAKKAAEAKPTN